jgi:pimeloyl-ACP methyl ester carboxylesterase
MKPTIVILHGWGLSHSRFIPLIKEFETRGYKVYAPDFPGFGESAMPDRPYTLTDYAQFFSDYLAEKHIQHAIVIGHSFGGRVALRYQTLYPHVLKALVFTGTPGFTPVPRKRLLLFISVAKVGKWIFSLPVLLYFTNSMKKWYYYVVGAREYNKAQGPMKDTFKNIVREKLDQDIMNVVLPTLLLWGENDTIVPLWIPKKIKNIIQHSELEIISDADHGVPFKQPNMFATHVIDWMKRHSLT